MLSLVYFNRIWNMGVLKNIFLIYSILMNSRIISLDGHIMNNNTIDISDSFSSIIADATRHIFWKFYYKSTSNIFIRLAYTDTKVDDLITRLINIENEKIYSSYVIENIATVPHLNYRRYFNVFLVENYDNFR